MKTEHFLLAGKDWVPNNPVLPVLVYRGAIDASSDFLSVGAYPDGEDWDIFCNAASKAAQKRMAELSLPGHDPVEGADGLLRETWRN